MRGREVSKEGSPGADFGFARALHDDVEVGGEGGKKREDTGEEGMFGGGACVDFVVEDSVEKDLQGVSKVGEGEILVSEVVGGGGVEVGEVELEDLGDEEMGLEGVSGE